MLKRTKSTEPVTLASVVTLALALGLLACSSPTDPGDPGGTQIPQGYPEVPRPTGPNDFDQPDQSSINATQEPIAGKAVDFVPYWEAGTFTWDIDIQTVYQTLTALGWEADADPASAYWNGTRHSSQLLFEGGVVDLRNPYSEIVDDLMHTEYLVGRGPMPRRILLVDGGEVVATPSNPHVPANGCYNDFGPEYGNKDVIFNPPIHGAIWDLDVEAGFGQRNKKRLYHVTVTDAPALTNPVYMMRERFWERVPVDGVKSVRVEPGTSKTVTYIRTTGMSYQNAYSFAEALDVTTSASPASVGLAVSSSTTETFSTTREVSEQESVSVSYTVSGIEDKVILFSVWQSVEVYSFVDVDGNPYTDPNYTFEDLGNATIYGDHQVLQSAVFPYED